MDNTSMIRITVTWSKIVATGAIMIATLFDVALLVWKGAETPATFLKVLPWSLAVIVAKQGVDLAGSGVSALKDRKQNP